MAWIPDAPETKQVPGPPVSRQVDEMHLVETHVLTPVDGVPSVKLTIVEGFREAGAFVQLGLQEVVVEMGPELQATMAKVSTGDFYSVFRDNAYELAVNVGALPSGVAQ